MTNLDFLTETERAARSEAPMHLELARQLIEARTLRDETKAAKTAAEKDFADSQARLNDYMVEHAMEPFRCDGFSVGINFTPQVSVLAANRIPLAEALHAHGFGALVKRELRIDPDRLEQVQQVMLELGVEDAVDATPVVHPSTLKTFIAEQRKENNDELPEWLAQLVSVFDQPTINLRKVT